MGRTCVHDGLFVDDNVGRIRSGSGHSGSDGGTVRFENDANRVSMMPLSSTDEYHGHEIEHKYMTGERFSLIESFEERPTRLTHHRWSHPQPKEPCLIPPICFSSPLGRAGVD
jgi:hypothetical protein